jgi:hypothetical protein
MFAFGPVHGVDHGIDGLQLAGAVDVRMARQDVLDQGGSRARHAEHEDRDGGRIAETALGGHRPSIA